LGLSGHPTCFNLIIQYHISMIDELNSTTFSGRFRWHTLYLLVHSSYIRWYGAQCSIIIVQKNRTASHAVH
jgi:hypothetical protein